MLKTFSLIIAAAALAVSAAADAKRLGGGKSVGAQREAPAATRQTAPPAANPQAAPSAAAAPTATAAGGAAAGAAAKSGMARWAGPLAAIAAGLGLGYLFSQLGAGGFLMFLLVALAAVIALVVLGRRLLRAPAPATANGAPFESAAGTAAPVRFEAATLGGAMAASIPEGFDKAGFEQQARRQFLALQAANDRGDLDAVRELTTDEFYNQVAKDVISGNAEATQFDMLDAELLSIDTDRGMHWAAVAFSGTVREDGMVMGSPFREVWNLNKPVDGSRGWLLAGIQQAS